MPELPLSRGRIVAIVAVTLAVLVVAGRFLLHAGATSSPTPPFRPAAAPAPAAARPMLVVDVVGAVRRAGLRRVPQGPRIPPAIAAPGRVPRPAAPRPASPPAPLAGRRQT